MKYSINTDSGTIDFMLVRKKMKNVRIRITGASKVIVSAPFYTSEQRIKQFVAENAAFINDKLKEINGKRHQYYPANYESGDTFFYLGARVRLNVKYSNETSAAFHNGVLTLHVPDNADYHYRKALFILWFQRHAKSYFSERMDNILPRFPHLKNIDLRISVKNMLSRWGSVNTKRHRLNLSVHLLRCTPELIDYVIMHELCHFRHANHSSAFYAELAGHCAYRKQYDRQLCQYGLVDF